MSSLRDVRTDISQTKSYADEPTIKTIAHWGETTSNFRVKESVLRNESQWFQDKLNAFSLTCPRIIHLPSHSETAVSTHLNLIGDAALPVIGTNNQCNVLLQVYSLTSIVGGPRTRNLAMQAIIAYFKGGAELPGSIQVSQLYLWTDVSSPLRRLIVYMFARKAPAAWFTRPSFIVHPDFLVDYVAQMTQCRDSSVSGWRRCF